MARANTKAQQNPPENEKPEEKPEEKLPEQAEKGEANAEPQGESKPAAGLLLVVKTRHGAPYRRCGRLFDGNEQTLDAADFTEAEIIRINNDPHLLVHFVEQAEAE